MVFKSGQIPDQSNKRMFFSQKILNNLIFATGSPIMHENVALINKYTHFYVFFNLIYFSLFMVITGA